MGISGRSLGEVPVPQVHKEQGFRFPPLAAPVLSSSALPVSFSPHPCASAFSPNRYSQQPAALALQRTTWHPGECDCRRRPELPPESAVTLLLPQGSGLSWAAEVRKFKEGSFVHIHLQARPVILCTCVCDNPSIPLSRDEVDQPAPWHSVNCPSHGVELPSCQAQLS